MPEFNWVSFLVVYAPLGALAFLSYPAPLLLASLFTTEPKEQ